MTTIITLNHFNDVYHVANHERLSHFARHLEEKAEAPDHPQSLTVFSGDCFSPSFEASVLKGDHMVPILNALNVDVSCPGNHDFDFGGSRFTALALKTKFPWLCANLVDVETRLPFPGTQSHLVKDIAGYRLGFFGLAGSDWTKSCSHLPANLVIENPVSVARTMAHYLRTVEQFDFVIAVTHLRLQEDLLVSNATKAPDNERVDLLLGGHDHDVVCRLGHETSTDPSQIRDGCTFASLRARQDYMLSTGDVRIVKSGSDFGQLSKITIHVATDQDGRAFMKDIRVLQIFDVSAVTPTSPTSVSGGISMAVQAAKIVTAYTEKFAKRPCMIMHRPLDGRSSIVRRQSSSMGNLLADALRAFFGAQIALINGGSIRCDRIIGKASKTYTMCLKDILDISPFQDNFMVKSVLGRDLIEAFNYSVQDEDDGRFLHCSGVRLWYQNRTADSGVRLAKAVYKSPFGTTSPIDPAVRYTVAMAAFIGNGLNGYTCLKAAPTLISPLEGVGVVSLLEEYAHQMDQRHRRAQRRRRLSDKYGKARSGQYLRHRRPQVEKSYEPSVPEIFPCVARRITFVTCPGFG